MAKFVSDIKTELTPNKILYLDANSKITASSINESDVATKDYVDTHIVAAPEYTIVKQAQAETGYAHTYYLTKDNVQTGAKINIPKDLVIESRNCRSCN